MIPKIIHYCWFGGSPMPEDQAAYVAAFTAQVAKTEKWGFIVDYIRAYVVYNYGGIYLDTDVELLKPFDDDILQNKCFSGFESDKYIAPGLIFAGEKGCAIAKELLDFYRI